MLNIKTKNRLSIFIALSVLAIIIIFFILKTLEDNVLYFYSPSDVEESNKMVFGDTIKIVDGNGRLYKTIIDSDNIKECILRMYHKNAC